MCKTTELFPIVQLSSKRKNNKNSPLLTEKSNSAGHADAEGDVKSETEADADVDGDGTYHACQDNKGDARLIFFPY